MCITISPALRLGFLEKGVSAWAEGGQTQMACIWYHQISQEVDYHFYYSFSCTNMIQYNGGSLGVNRSGRNLRPVCLVV